MSFKNKLLHLGFIQALFLCSISIEAADLGTSKNIDIDADIVEAITKDETALNCAIDTKIDTPVVVEYQIKVETKRGTTNRNLQLWRNKNQVAIHYPETGITELWEKTKNDKLHLVRFFESHQRGIEYQPGEINGSHDWSAKHQLISDSMIATMQLETTTGNGCERVRSYSRTTPKGSSQLEWLENKGLIASYIEVTDRYKSTSTLQAISTDSNKVKEKFETLNSYQTTDYTDVGDNESDPFLMGMINLGFIEHGSTGFYDSNGHSMDSH